MSDPFISGCYGAAVGVAVWMLLVFWRRRQKRSLLMPECPHCSLYHPPLVSCRNAARVYGDGS